MIINDQIYGKQEITDQVAIDIMNTSAMQRLKGVNQYGVWDLFDSKYFTSRFDHCVGVYLLLRKLGAKQDEQLSGLIHDVAHTALSHVIDYAFDDIDAQRVHEDFHHEIIDTSQIPNVLKKYNLDPTHIADEFQFGILEKDLPDLCADRMDYFMRDGLITGVFTKKDISNIMHSLVVYNNEIMVNNYDIGKFLIEKSMEMTRTFWGSHVQAGSYQLMGNIIKEKLESGIITPKDFYMQDTEFLEKLDFDRSAFTLDRIQMGTKEDHTFFTKTKARYVDPNVVVDGVVTRTSDFFPTLKETITKFKEEYKKGWYIKLV